MMLVILMKFIYCHWVFNQWQGWVNVQKNGKGTVTYKRKNSSQNNTKKTENTQNTKQENTHTENINFCQH